MPMPENITLINKKTKLEKTLDFHHAQRLLCKMPNTFDLKNDKYEFNGSDIVRKKKSKNKEESE